MCAARKNGQSDLSFPTLKQVKLYVLWVLEVIVSGVGGEQEMRRVEKKINPGQTNQQPHFHAMYEMRYLDHQTGDVHFDS